MPYDVGDFSDLPPGERGATRRNRGMIAAWLFAICFMILVMVVLGGLTRLTGSGLSIMEWAPLSGILPPLDHAQWERLYALYKQIPQYRLVNDGFGLAGFQRIFWLEWVHRLWGRLIGVAVLVPLIWFWATGRLSRRLLARMGLFFALGGLQGAVGWFMVASGFSRDAVAVAPARLALHLALALALYAAILWTALSVRHPARRAPPATTALRRASAAYAGLLALTILAGAIVAGTHAGLVFDTFPLMDGHLLVPGYARLHPFARNLLANLGAVQFDHRLLATLTALAGLLVLALAARRDVPRFVRFPILALAALTAVQYALGVLTLLNAVPLPLAALHQANAVLTLTAALVALHALRPLPLGPRFSRRARLARMATRPGGAREGSLAPSPRAAAPGIGRDAGGPGVEKP